MFFGAHLFRIFSYIYSRLLSKLSSSALQSGLVTSCVALVVLCSFLQNNESNSTRHALPTTIAPLPDERFQSPSLSTFSWVSP
jgi:hypothetical protein